MKVSKSSYQGFEPARARSQLAEAGPGARCIYDVLYVYTYIYNII